MTPEEKEDLREKVIRIQEIEPLDKYVLLLIGQEYNTYEQIKSFFKRKEKLANKSLRNLLKKEYISKSKENIYSINQEKLERKEI